MKSSVVFLLTLAVLVISASPAWAQGMEVLWMIIMMGAVAGWYDVLSVDTLRCLQSHTTAVCILQVHTV
jgi:hypothetical protein